MGIQIALNHQTGYQYDHHVSLDPQIVRLRPAPHCRTLIQSYSIKVLPDGHFENWQQDPYGNFPLRLVFPQKVRHFQIQVDVVAEMTVVNPFDFFVESSAAEWPFDYEAWLARELRPYRELEPPGPQTSAYLETVERRKQNTVDFLVALNRKLQQEITYVIRMEPGIQSCEETLTLRSGSCRDTAWLLVQVLRHLGFAARFVWGYLVQLVPDIKPLDGPAGPAKDFTDLHAWTKVYLPGAGWIGLDPTSGLLAGEGHIPLACTPEPAGAAPAPIALRVFAIRTASGYQLMSGGLVRVVKDMRLLDPALWIGETSKDAWVIAEREVAPVSLLQPAGQVTALRRGTAELPSRVADNMFWLGRYVEPADAASRIMRTLASRLINESNATASAELAPLLRTLVDEGHLQTATPIEDLPYPSDQLEQVLARCMFDPEQQAGVLATLRSLDRTLNLVTDRLSLDGWKILARLFQEFQRAFRTRRPTFGDFFELLGRAIVDLAAFGGIAAESMTRSQSWRFMEFGRRLERALHMITLVKSFLAEGSCERTSLLDTLLLVADSQMTYRSRYLANLRLAPVLDLLLTDETNPRSLAFQLVAIENHVSQLPRDHSQALLGPDQQLAMNMLNSIRQVDTEMLGATRRGNEQKDLDKLLLRLEKQLPRLSDLVSHKYFVHAGSPRQLAERRFESR